MSGILKANEVTMRLHPMQPADVEHAIRLYVSGLSLAKVAEQLPYDPSTIWQAMRKLGITLRDSHGRS